MRASIAGIDRNVQKDHLLAYRWLTLTDVLFSSLVIAPLVVGFWCSTWGMLDYCSWTRRRPLLIAVLSSGTGFAVTWLFTAFQTELNETFSIRIANKIVYLLCSRLYTLIFGVASVHSWRGIWTIFDQYTDLHVASVIFIVVLSYAGLIGTKTVRNLTSSPLALMTDRKQGYFDVPTLFRWPNYWKKNKLLYLLDSVFSVMIVGILVILVWRGTWCLLDTYIYPEDSVRSGLISLVLGYGIVFITFLLQPVMKVLIKKYHHWRRLVIIDIYVVISFCGTINIWRGMWAVYDEYCDLDNIVNSCLLHFGTFFILVLFNSSNTLLVRGVYIDAEENAENCIEFPCYYFRLMFQERQKRNALSNLNQQHQKDTLLPTNGTTNVNELPSSKIKEPNDVSEVLSTNGNLVVVSSVKTTNVPATLDSYRVESKLIINDQKVSLTNTSEPDRRISSKQNQF